MLLPLLSYRIWKSAAPLPVMPGIGSRTHSGFIGPGQDSEFACPDVGPVRAASSSSTRARRPHPAKQTVELGSSLDTFEKCQWWLGR